VDLDAYKNIQSLAKKVHDRLHDYIDSRSTEESIVQKSVEILSEYGISETWYHGVPAFVLLGSRSCVSISGRDYSPSTETVGETNLVTVDLSPSWKGIWGDCARSYFIEDGRCTDNPQLVEFQEGKSAEAELHREMKEFVIPKTRFNDLFEFGNHKIKELGFENLDFLGNLGHSIETKTSSRRFIDKKCHETLGSVKLFTFEPHIRKIGGSWGFKHENIYYFTQSGQVQEL
jgi:Xaa-Pro aminopeptidase